MISGMLSYCDRYRESIKRVLKSFGPVPEFSGPTVEKVNQVCWPLQRTVLAEWKPWAAGGALFVAESLILMAPHS